MSDIPYEPRKSQRVREEKILILILSSQAIVFLVKRDREFIHKKTPILLNIEEDSKTFSEAMSSRAAILWKWTVNDEMKSIISNNTWVLVNLPLGSKIIGCKWVFKRKYNTNGTL